MSRAGAAGAVLLRSLPVLLAVAVLGGVLTAGSACDRADQAKSEKTDTPRNTNVVIFLIDTLRADRIGAYGYDKTTTPNLDALADRSVVFESAYAPAPWTLPSVVSLMTSRFPCQHGVLVDRDRIDDSLTPMAERFRHAGYRTASFYANPYAGKMTGLDRGFDTCQMKKAVRGGIVRDWLREAPGRPFFLYIHNIEPHNPYNAPTRLVERFGEVSKETRQSIRRLLLQYRKFTRVDFAARRPRGTTDNTDAQERAMRALDAYKQPLDTLYDAAVRWADENLGSVVEALKEAGLWDVTLFIALSDHGEELGDHGGWQHDQSVYEELVHVPMIVHFPGDAYAGTRVRPVVSLVDLMPTIFHYLGRAQQATETAGRNLMPLIRGESSEAGMIIPTMRINRKKYFRPYAEQRGDINIVVRDGRWKAIYNADIASVELYDLVRDPHEVDDVSHGQGKRADAMKHWARAWYNDCVQHNGSSGPATETMDAETLERLRSLGYVE